MRAFFLVFLNSIIYYYNINRRKLVEKDSPNAAIFTGENRNSRAEIDIPEKEQGDKKKHLTPELTCGMITKL